VRRFNVALVLLYLASVAGSVPVVYYFARKQVEAQAARELNLLVDMVKSVQGYVVKDLRPYLTKQQIFYSPAVSGIVATARIARNFQELQPAYYIKSSSDNPLNEDNWPEPLEQQLLERYRGDEKLGNLIEIGTIKGRNYLVSSTPKASTPECLRCHGDPQQAPDDVRKTYGTTSGYHYEPKGVVGVSVVGVPFEDIQSVTVQRSLWVTGMLTALFAAIFVIVNLLVRRYLISPILSIARTASAVSQGDLEQQVRMDRNDELGELAHSFELMRRSLVSAMKRMR
jgi:HAMP domain-containing protein